MSGSKKLVISLSETLCNEFDNALREDSKKRSEFIRDAIILYIRDRKKTADLELMKRGYLEMAQLNLEISELSFAGEIHEFLEYEAKLSESDIADDGDGEKRRYILC